MLDLKSLSLFCPRAADFQAGIEAAVRFANLDSGLRLAYFLGQCAHESGGFARLEENLNYSAQGLANTWPKRFAKDHLAEKKTPNDLALRLSRQPELIANSVYSSRLGNGAEATGDGWRYRGRGLIQLTGRDNYARASLALFNDERLVQTPAQVEQPLVACLTAAWFWAQRGLNQMADRDDVRGATRAINGGLVGLEDRQHWIDRARQALGVS